MPRCRDWWVRGALIVLAHAAPGTAAFAQKASGEVVGIIPDASALRSDGRWSLAVDQPVYMGDRIQTGSVGEAQINFIDDTRLVVGAASSLLIDSSVLRNQRTMKHFIVSALRGTFRFISGSSPKPAYAIRTPTATIGVRGTLFDFAVLPDGTTEFVLLHGAARVCNRGGACVVADRSCTAISVPPGGPPRPVSDIAERNARLRSYFPYIRNPTANLRREFQADVRSCGNIAAAPLDRGQELRLEVAPAAVAPPTPPTPRPPTPEPPTPPPTVEPPTPPVVVPDPPSKPHRHHDKDHDGKQGHRDRDGRHGRHGSDHDGRVDSRSHDRHRDFDRDSRGGFGHRAGDRDGFGRGSAGAPPGGPGAHGGHPGRAGPDVGQGGGRNADRGAGRARGDESGTGPAVTGGDQGRSRGADRSSDRGQDTGRADHGHQSRGDHGRGPDGRSDSRSAGPGSERGAERGSGRGDRGGHSGWGGDARGGDSWGGGAMGGGSWGGDDGNARR